MESEKVIEIGAFFVGESVARIDYHPNKPEGHARYSVAVDRPGKPEFRTWCHDKGQAFRAAVNELISDE